MAKRKHGSKRGSKRHGVTDPNVLGKSFDKVLAKNVKEVAPSAGAGTEADVGASPGSSLVFAAMAVGPCAALYASPKFGITLADKGVILIAVAVLAVALLTQAYSANVKSARGTAGRKKSTAELQNYAIFFVNLAFLLLFLFVGFVVLPTVGGLVPAEASYVITVAGNALFIYLWQQGIILKGIA